MNFTELMHSVSAQKCVGFRYQQDGRHAFRDRVSVYYDGKIFFERFCYGESAGLVFTMWADSAQADGTILWNYDACPNSHKTEAPKKLTGGDEKALLFDEKSTPWSLDQALKSDKPNGYHARVGAFLGLFRKA
ncbi:MAG: hypothetical protein RSF70_09555 [Ruthenibacterium sp.]